MQFAVMKGLPTREGWEGWEMLDFLIDNFDIHASFTSHPKKGYPPEPVRWHRPRSVKGGRDHERCQCRPEPFKDTYRSDGESETSDSDPDLDLEVSYDEDVSSDEDDDDEDEEEALIEESSCSETPLHIAIVPLEKDYSVEAAEKLLRAGAVLSSASAPASWALGWGSKEKVVTRDGPSPLLHAALWCVGYLKKPKWKKLKAYMPDGPKMETSTRMVEMLLKHGCNPNHFHGTIEADCALTRALLQGNYDAAKLLVINARRHLVVARDCARASTTHPEACQ